jgi:hypothetical protein
MGVEQVKRALLGFLPFMLFGMALVVLGHAYTGKLAEDWWLLPVAGFLFGAAGAFYDRKPSR